jgi:hypothetical protein
MRAAAASEVCRQLLKGLDRRARFTHRRKAQMNWRRLMGFFPKAKDHTIPHHATAGCHVDHGQKGLDIGAGYRSGALSSAACAEVRFAPKAEVGNGGANSMARPVGCGLQRLMTSARPSFPRLGDLLIC